jgi:hypothetical protein
VDAGADLAVAWRQASQSIADAIADETEVTLHR